MYLLYSLALALALVCGSPYWLYQSLRHGKYRKGLSERLGRIPQRLRIADQPSIWVHAVSVGEVLAVSRLVQQMRTEFPEYRILVSTTTDTGQALAASRFGADNVFYFPFDFRFAVRSWIRAIRPKLVLIAETEFWPNFLRSARSSEAQVGVVNARISNRSLSGYRRWKFLLERVLRNIDFFVAQTNEDARRLIEIGAEANKVFVGGNLKYDVLPPREVPVVGQLRGGLDGAGPVLVCGSTVEGEEEILLNAFRQLLAAYPHALMLLAPRHPERFESVRASLQRSGIPFRRRSEWAGEPLAGSVLLIDSIGELASLYVLADLAFVGGSLVPRGGHNILEPAQFGAPIAVGEHTENFRDIVDLFKGQNALRVVTGENIASTFAALLADRNQLVALGQRAQETIRSQQGATEFTLAKIREALALAREATPA